MNKRFTLLVLGLIMLNIFNLKAQQITSTQALESAKAFWGNYSSPQRAKAAKSTSSTKMELVYIGGNFTQPDFYIYNVGENEGFMVVGGDERMRTILAYSTEGRFDLATAPEGFMDLLQSYSEQTEEIRSAKSQKTKPSLIRKKAVAETLTNSVGIALLDTVSMKVTKTDGTEKILTGIKYDQSEPYHNFCPMINGGRAYTGCGATAMVQLMRFHRYPSSGEGSHKNISYANDSTIDFSKAVYRWDLMLPNYSNNKNNANYGNVENRNAVALAMHHAGVATDMIYSTNGSGTGSLPVARALASYFKYNKGMEIARKLVYTEAEWFALIKNELDHGRPVLYSGTSKTGGHFFVCDGYDDAGRLHYNYGWSGTYNAWAYPTVAPAEGGTVCKYTYSVDAIIGADPAAINVKPQLAQLSVLNVSNLAPKVDSLFNVSFRISNYGRNTYESGKVKLALCKKGTDEITAYLTNGETTLTIPTNNYDAGPDNIRYQEVKFTGVKIPKIANGIYDLKCFASPRGDDSIYPLLARNEYVQKVITVQKRNDGTTIFSYGLGDEQGEIGVSNKINLSVNGGIGKATIPLKNSDTDYNYTGKIFVIGYKDNTATMELFGSAEVDILPAKEQEIVISGMHMKSGSYHYFVAYNPIDNIDGSWLGAVPIKESQLAYEVPAETEDYKMDFTALTRLPEGYKQYKEDLTGNNIYISNTPENDQLAPWVYNKFPLFKATSVVRPDQNRLSNTLITDAIEVKDINGVLEWQLQPMGGDYENPIPFDVYISTKGNSLEDFDGENSLFYRDSIDVASGVHTMRESLYKYANQKIYIAFKHSLNSNGANSMLNFLQIRILNIASPHDIALSKVEVPVREAIGEPLPITITVNNQAPFPITKFTATYTVTGNSFTEEFTHKGLPYDTPTQFTLTKATVTGKPGDNLDVRVTLSMEDEDKNLLDNNTGSATCKAMSFQPDKTMVVYKTSRGACGACMLTYAHMDWLEEYYPECFAAVELWEPWSGQPTHLKYGCDDFKDFYSGSTPSITLNNKNVNFHTTDEIIRHTGDQLLKESPVANTKVDASYISADSRTLKIKLTSRFAMPMTGTYKVGVFIIESNVLANDFQILNASLAAGGHTKNHLPIAAPQGAKGQLSPYTIENPINDQDHVFEFTYDVPETHGETGDIRNVNKDNIQVIGVLFTPSGTIDSSSLNCYYVRIPKTNGLTFVAEPECDPFKEILEVKEKSREVGQFESIRRMRSTVMAKNDFRFHIEKDPATIGNKKVRLSVRKSETEAATILIPDADGIYTLKDVNRYYFIDVEVLTDEEEPTVTRKGTGIILNGSWDGIDFNRILPIDNSITSVDMSAITIPVDAPQLIPANPNCLLYVGQSSTVPATWKNVISGTEAETINLVDGYAFCNTKEFTAANISYTRTYPQAGWSSLYLPFGVTKLPDGINLESYTACNGSEVRFSPLQALSTTANTPYIAEITSCDEKTFSAQEAIVKISSDKEDIKHEGDLVFKGTLTEFAPGEAEGLYILKPTGEGFIKGGAKTTIPAFRAYLENMGIDQVMNILVDHTAVTNVESGTVQNDLRVYTNNDKLIIITDKEMQAEIFSIDGKTIRNISLTSGENIIEGLTKGFYLVKNHKVCIQ